MTFLLFLIHIIGIGFFGLFLYRYEQFNQFQIMPYEKGLYVIDKKHKTITHCDDKSCHLIYQKQESHTNYWGCETPQPSEKTEKKYDALQPMSQTPQPPEYQQQPLPSTYEPQQPTEMINPPQQNNLPPVSPPTVSASPTSHFPTNKVENMAYNVAKNVAQEPSNYEHILNSHENQNDRDNPPYS